MGNTPSNQASPARNAHPTNTANGNTSQHASTSTSPNPAPSTRNPNLRLPMPSRPTHISPQSSNPTSPSGRGTSPRRRKSLELPDLNRLTFTPAAPVPTTATHTSHHFAPSTPAATHVKKDSLGGSSGTSSGPGRWKAALGGKSSPLAGANALGAMSKLDNSVPAPRAASPSRLKEVTNNPYFPAGGSTEVSPTRDRGRQASPRQSIDAQIQPQPAKAAGTSLSPVVDSPRDVSQEGEMKDGLVSVPIQWTGGGKVVYVTGNFADNWKGRVKLRKSTHDFNTILRLAPGQYRLKFIVDDSWRCSKQISTATDDDGTLVNWIEVEAARSDEEMKAEWSSDQPTPRPDADDSQWTSIIPPPLALYQYLEELPHTYTPEVFSQLYNNVPHLSAVPQPPTLPRILDKVIVNVESKKLYEDGIGNSALVPAGLDDNSILAVPNHVVLNHLTASAIKNGTLGVGTTTRYRKKYITTMFFKPTLADLMGDGPPSSIPSSIPSLGDEIPASGR